MSRSVSNTSAPNQKPPGCMGIGVCLFSCIFIFAGIGIAFSTLKKLSWKEVPCQIESFKITHDRKNDDPFEAQIRYSYQWEGQNFTGSKLTSSDTNRESDYEKLVEAERKLSRRGTCYLDPNIPEEAILERKLSGIWFGLIFAAAGSLFFTVGLNLFKNRKGKPEALSSKAKVNSDITKGPAGFLFFGIFAAVGTAIFLFLVVPPAKKYFAAKSWQPVEATVIWSIVRSHSSDDGTTYSPDIFYRYDFKGERHRSNTYSLMSGSSSGRDSKKEVVDAYPRGHKFTAYVNPKKPWQAVMKRKLGWGALFALFPLPFMAVGFGGLWWMIFRAGKEDSSSTNALSGRKTTPNHLSTRTHGKPKGADDGASSLATSLPLSSGVESRASLSSSRGKVGPKENPNGFSPSSSPLSSSWASSSSFPCPTPSWESSHLASISISATPTSNPVSPPNSVGNKVEEKVTLPR